MATNIHNTYYFTYESPIGMLNIQHNGSELISLRIQSTQDKNNLYAINKDIIYPIEIETSKQLDEYFLGRRKNFTVPTLLQGTNFQISVWKQIEKIPYGSVKTYKEIASSIRSPQSARAVGNAAHNNSLAIIIPCHRVIGSNNSLVGYAFGLNIKSFLLNLESNFS